ncbi:MULTISPECIES: alginate O-acetyltransferase [unclassified Pseudomonas]|uniref:alginate O-acetyltransferase n=1 Tax=unclassified Pseudomonas TaxID=196821 RepID=UPI000DAA58BE|nr:MULTISPECIES: alginate O-acetyltransferase [unclassified Pseudomonas]MDW3713058.1 alginate O-acetyltransferase [Pseudomonas sp. 2023EL-01195]PZE14592.1 alginate O-acetyltransferase [Pseudomonas sp. 57B-090624]
MHNNSTRWFAPSALAAALLAGAHTAQAAEPQYSVQRTGPLCAAAQNPNTYNTKYLSFFTALVQAKDDWLFRSRNDLRTDFGTTPYGYSEFKRLRDALKAKGVELMVVYQPTRGLINREKLTEQEKARFDFELAKKNYLKTVADFRKTGIWVTDLSPLFDEQGVDTDYYFKADHHWTPAGADRTAKLVAETLKEMPGFADIPKKEFSSKVVGLLPKAGTLHKTAGQLCGTTYATQYVERYETEASGEAGGDSLFGDESNPQIVLVGTSNSGPAYNFGGFLQQHSGAEVLNMAVSGGGFDSALLQYMTSKEFHENPPKIIVWEFATHYDMAQKSFYRQAVPLVNNGCEGRKAVMHNKVKMKPGANEVFVNGQNGAVKDIRSGDYQVDLTFSDPSVHESKATIWYLNGRRENFKIEQSDRVDTGGRYVFELRDDPDWRDLNVLALEIHSPEEMPENLSVDVTLCKRPGNGGDTLTAKAE